VLSLPPLGASDTAQIRFLAAEEGKFEASCVLGTKKQPQPLAPEYPDENYTKRRRDQTAQAQGVWRHLFHHLDDLMQSFGKEREEQALDHED